MITQKEIDYSSDFFFNLCSISNEGTWAAYFESSDFNNEIQHILLEERVNKKWYRLESEFNFCTIDVKIAPIFLSESVIAFNYQNNQEEYGLLIYDLSSQELISQVEKQFAVNKSQQEKYLYLVDKKGLKFSIFEWKNEKKRDFYVFDAGLDSQDWKFDAELSTPCSDGSEEYLLLCISSEKHNENRLYSYQYEKGFRFVDLREQGIYNVLKPFYHPQDRSKILTFAMDEKDHNDTLICDRTFSLIQIQYGDILCKSEAYHLFPDGNTYQQVDADSLTLLTAGIALDQISSEEDCGVCLDDISHSKDESPHILLEVGLDDLEIKVKLDQPGYKRSSCYCEESIHYLEKGKIKTI